MAITTENEKLSLIGLLMPFSSTLPRPTGATFDQGDLQHLIRCFSSTDWGVLASASEPVTFSSTLATLTFESFAADMTFDSRAAAMTFGSTGMV